MVMVRARLKSKPVYRTPESEVRLNVAGRAMPAPAGRVYNENMVFQESFTVQTRGRGSYPITDVAQKRVKASGIGTGICNIFVHHTSASLILCENADPDVRFDLERFMARTVPDGDPLFEHTAEGPDDMPAHIRTILTDSGLTLPVTGGRCDLGTWQGVYLWEHRTIPHIRRVTVTVFGE